MKITIHKTKKGLRYVVVAQEGKPNKKINVPSDMRLKELKLWIRRTFAPRKAPAKKAVATTTNAKASKLPSHAATPLTERQIENAREAKNQELATRGEKAVEPLAKLLERTLVEKQKFIGLKTGKEFEIELPDDPEAIETIRELVKAPNELNAIKKAKFDEMVMFSLEKQKGYTKQMLDKWRDDAKIPAGNPGNWSKGFFVDLPKLEQWKILFANKVPKALEARKSMEDSVRELIKSGKIKLFEDEKKGAGNKNDGITTKQINFIMEPRYGKRYLGAIARDEIPYLKVENHKNGIGFIMNKDPSTKGGSHWVAWYFSPTQVCYYDSFGEEPQPVVMPLIKAFVKKLAGTDEAKMKFKINRIVDQRANSSNCGYFAMRFLMKMLDGKHFMDSSHYSDVLKQERQIKAFKEKFPAWKYFSID